MLRRLQNRLRIFLIIIFMAVVSLILCFSFWNTWQARQIADITYIQADGFPDYLSVRS